MSNGETKMSTNESDNCDGGFGRGATKMALTERGEKRVRGGAKIASEDP